QKTKWNLSNSGTWDQLANGDRVWRLRVVGRNAKSINFLLSQFRIPVGAKLYAYNDDHTYKVGAFTSRNHQPDFRFAIAPVRGEAVTLEYHEPAAVSGQGRITISHVIQAYRDLFRMANDVTRDYGDAGACNIDVACPQASPWTDQVRSVGLIIVGGSRNCTGTLLNNTAQDGTPYFLTANHCMGAAVPGTLLSNWVFVFNYDSPTCGGVDGTLLDGITGGVVRAAYDDADMALLELNSSPPASYNTYFAGWNRADIASDSCTGISHPRGDVKKIAFNRNPLISVQGPGAVDHFWEVTEWEMGTTEPTSSGSGLFDPNGRVIGQLFGGSASCSNNTGYDQYGKIAKSWEGSGTPASRLKDWLDPSQSNDTTIDGTYTFSLPRWDIGVVSISSINSQNCDSVINPILTIRNFGSETITKVDITYDYGLSSSLFQWTGSLASRSRLQVNLPTSAVLPLGAYL
ncbi:MAG: trypsin-like peptidase domain-containing protein, partial [Methylococcales bacterium]|nr:trypsin-like peptidase domain-containing protein [Methylococcales bacterium]